MKRTLAGLLALLLCLSLLACGQSTKPADVPSADGQSATGDTVLMQQESGPTPVPPRETVRTRLVSGDYVYDEYSDGTATIIDYDGSAAELTIPAELDGLRVTGIGKQAFSGCEALTSVSIPESVTSIEQRAFASCKSLTSVRIPEGVPAIADYMFYNCTALESIDIPESVTSIGREAFLCCPLASVKLPNGLTSIGPRAFSGCFRLESVNIPDSVTSIGGGAFYGTPWLRAQPKTDGWVEIGNGVHFVYVGAETAVTVPDGVKSFDFDGNDYVQQVVIPEGVTSIAEWAFLACGSLTSVTLPNSLTSLEDNAFRNCHALLDIVIPEGVVSIGKEAFDGCDVLVSVTIPQSVTSIGESAFSGCKLLASLTIPDSVTSIGKSAFRNCNALTITCSEGSAAHRYATENNIPWAAP